METAGDHSQRDPAQPGRAASVVQATAADSLHHLPVVTFALDRHGIVTLYDQGSVASASFTESSVQGRHFSEIASKAGIANAEALFDQVLRGSPVALSVDFGRRQFIMRAVPMPDAHGVVQSLLGVVIEITHIPIQREGSIATQEPFRAIIDSIEDGYYEVDLAGRFTLINQAMADILGLPHSALLQGEVFSFERFADEQQAQQARQLYRRVLRTGQPVRAADGQVIRPDGTERSIEVSISLLRAADGRPCGYRGIVRDVTGRRVVEAALAERIRLLSLLQGVDDELNLTLDLDQVALVGLSSAMRLSGAEAGFIGLLEDDPDVLRVLRAVGLPEHSDTRRILPAATGVVGRAMRLRQPQVVIDVASDPDYVPDIPGTRAEIAIPLITHDRLLGVLNLETTQPDQFSPTVVEFVQILSTRTAAAIENARLYALSQRQLEQMRDVYSQLSALEQLKTDMIRIASHDLRSPLGIIFGYLDILSFDLDAALNDEQRSYFEAMRRAAVRIQRMSTEILSLERVNALRNLPRTRVNLNELATQAIIDHHDAARQKHINLITDIGEPMHVLADAASLPEAMTNLIGNAIKYTPEGGFVTVTLRRAGDRAEFEVADTGMGIREDDQKRLFEPFYRVKSEESAHIDGTGLGLYLVRRIVELHNGTLHFASEFGKGSQFGFTMPLVLQPEAPEHA